MSWRCEGESWYESAQDQEPKTKKQVDTAVVTGESWIIDPIQIQRWGNKAGGRLRLRGWRLVRDLKAMRRLSDTPEFDPYVDYS